MDTEIAEAEMRHVDLEQCRRVARHFHPGGGDPGKDTVAREPEDGERDGQRKPDRHRQKRNFQGDQRTVEHLRQCPERLVPVEGVAEHRRFAFRRDRRRQSCHAPPLKPGDQP